NRRFHDLEAGLLRLCAPRPHEPQADERHHEDDRRHDVEGALGDPHGNLPRNTPRGTLDPPPAGVAISTRISRGGGVIYLNVEGVYQARTTTRRSVTHSFRITGVPSATVVKL